MVDTIAVLIILMIVLFVMVLFMIANIHENAKNIKDLNAKCEKSLYNSRLNLEAMHDLMSVIKATINTKETDGDLFYPEMKRDAKDIIKTARLKKLMTYKMLEKATGISSVYLSILENGKKPFTRNIETLYKISKALDIPFNVLLNSVIGEEAA